MSARAEARRSADGRGMLKERLRHIDVGSYGVVALVALALAVAYLLYPRPREESAQAAKTEIVFWISGTVTDEMRAAVEEFERRNSQYKVLLGTATVRDAVGDPTRFLLGVAGGEPPDLIYFDRFAIVEWGSRGAFLDLTDLIERDRDRPDGIRKEDYVAPAWNEPIYQGKNYAIANGIDTRAMFYTTNALIRAGFVYEEDDPEVRSGEVQAGEARPPKTWEEMCRRLVYAEGVAQADGLTTLTAFTRKPSVNEDLPSDAKIDLAAAGVRPGDVIALVKNREVFRGRVKSVESPNSVRFDFGRDQGPGVSEIPAAFRAGCEVKIFDQESYVCKLTRFDAETGRITHVGFIPLDFGNSWLYMYGWLNGARFMDEDGTVCRLDSPEIVEALQWMTDIYDAQGGFKEVKVLQANVNTGPLDPYFTENVIFRVDGDWFMETLIAYKANLEFGVAPAPLPEKRLKAGAQPIGWSGGWSYAIPSSARQIDGAWKLARWLSTEEANKLMFEFKRSLMRSQGQVYFPRLHPHRGIMALIQRDYIDANPAISPRMKKAFNVFVDLLPRSKYRPVTPVGQKLWNEHQRAGDTATTHGKDPYDALSYGKRRVQIELDRVLNPPSGPTVNWLLLIALYVLALVALFGALAWRQERKRRLYGGRRRAWLEGYIAASPWLIGFIVFGAGPIVFSIVISFCHYDVLNPARFIGLTNYENLMGWKYDPVLEQNVANDPIFWKSMGNTLFMVIQVPLSILLGLALALLLDTQVRGLHVYRTLYYLPAIVPAVAAFILWIWIFDPGRGMLNQVLMSMGVADPPKWLQDQNWAKPSLILMNLWAVGASMIIWLAGLKDIPESMYEAAAIDGAGRLQRFFRITIPLLSPYILFNAIMGMIYVFQIFEQAYVMTDGKPADSTLFYAYKLFNEAFKFLNMGAASAMAWVLFMVVLAITLFQLWLSKKWVHYGGQ